MQALNLSCNEELREFFANFSSNELEIPERNEMSTNNVDQLCLGINFDDDITEKGTSPNNEDVKLKSSQNDNIPVVVPFEAENEKVPCFTIEQDLVDLQDDYLSEDLSEDLTLNVDENVLDSEIFDMIIEDKPFEPLSGSECSNLLEEVLQECKINLNKEEEIDEYFRKFLQENNAQV